MLTLNKPSNTINKIPLGETGCLCIFFFFWGHFFSFFFECLGIQFFYSPLLFISLTQSVRLPTPYGYLPLTVQPLCDLQDVMPCHWSPGASHPSPLTSSLNLLWAVVRFLDLFYTFSPAHCRVVCDFPLPIIFTVSAMKLLPQKIHRDCFFIKWTLVT